MHMMLQRLIIGFMFLYSGCTYAAAQDMITKTAHLLVKYKNGLSSCASSYDDNKTWQQKMLWRSHDYHDLGKILEYICSCSLQSGSNFFKSVVCQLSSSLPSCDHRTLFTALRTTFVGLAADIVHSTSVYVYHNTDLCGDRYCEVKNFYDTFGSHDNRFNGSYRINNSYNNVVAGDVFPYFSLIPFSVHDGLFTRHSLLLHVGLACPPLLCNWFISFFKILNNNLTSSLLLQRYLENHPHSLEYQNIVITNLVDDAALSSILMDTIQRDYPGTAAVRLIQSAVQVLQKHYSADPEKMIKWIERGRGLDGYAMVHALAFSEFLHNQECRKQQPFFKNDSLCDVQRRVRLLR